jgi:hypothetical protein
MPQHVANFAIYRISQLKIIKIHTRDADYKGYTHHASPDDPQYEIKGDKTDHIVMHKDAALKKTHA